MQIRTLYVPGCIALSAVLCSCVPTHSAVDASPNVLTINKSVHRADNGITAKQLQSQVTDIEQRLQKLGSSISALGDLRVVYFCAPTVDPSGQRNLPVPQSTDSHDPVDAPVAVTAVQGSDVYRAVALFKMLDDAAALGNVVITQCGLPDQGKTKSVLTK